MKNILIVLILIISGCTFDIGVSGGRSCIGFGCGFKSVETPSDRLTFSLIYSTTFESNIKPSIDNFLQRYRVEPNNAQLNYWVTDFFQPARRIFGNEFKFDPNIKLEVSPNTSAINISVIQQYWNEIDTKDPMFEKYVAFSNIPKEIVSLIRRRIEVNGKIYSHSANSIDYHITIDMFLEVKTLEGKYVRINKSNSDFQKFVFDLYSLLINEYYLFFKNKYNLNVKNKEALSMFHGEKYNK